VRVVIPGGSRQVGQLLARHRTAEAQESVNDARQCGRNRQHAQQAHLAVPRAGCETTSLMTPCAGRSGTRHLAVFKAPTAHPIRENAAEVPWRSA
jgi:hypothetical protein